jgi:hypothetical protein
MVVVAVGVVEVILDGLTCRPVTSERLPFRILKGLLSIFTAVPLCKLLQQWLEIRIRTLVGKLAVDHHHQLKMHSDVPCTLQGLQNVVLALENVRGIGRVGTLRLLLMTSQLLAVLVLILNHQP